MKRTNRPLGGTLTLVISGCLMFISAFLLSGCLMFTNYEWDLSKNSNYWGGYDPNVVYYLKRPVLFDGYSLSDHFYWPLDGSVRDLVSYDQYLKAQSNYPGITVILKGTPIYFRHYRVVRSIECTTEGVSGVFADGPLAGKEVGMSEISMIYPNSHFHDNKPTYVKFHGSNLYLFWPSENFLTSSTTE